MLEKDAKTKRCCGPFGCGNSYNSEPERYCIGSECMAWEPEYDRVEKEIPYKTDIENKVIVPDGWHHMGGLRNGITNVCQYVENNKGDCGLKTKELVCNGI